MAGQGRLHSHACSFLITNLAHHDDIRVLTQYAAQGPLKGHANGLLHLDLVDQANLILHWIFYGQYVPLRTAQQVQG